MALYSLLLGLLAWALPLWYCGRPGDPRRFSAALWGSGAACGAALTLQLVSIRAYVAAGDWAALLDTADAVVRAAWVLLTVTALLDLLAVLIHRDIQKRADS